MRDKQRFVLPGIGGLLLAVCVWCILFRATAPPSAADQTLPGNLREASGRSGTHSGISPSFTSPPSSTEFRSKAAPSLTADPVVNTVPGPPVGFLLSEIDSSLLSTEEDSTLFEVQKKFAAMMAQSPVTDPSSPEYRHQWKLAQQYCDDLLRQRLGVDGFNRMNFLASQETERMKKP
jgi:hypothetical protein